MTGQVTKAQHYVPQLLLRNFANRQRDDTHRLEVMDMERKSVRGNQSVKNVCVENYFYDKDNKVETLLERYVETPAADSVRAICSSSGNIKSKPSRELYQFVAVLMNRTPKAKSEFQECANGMTKTVFRELARLNGFDEDEGIRIMPSEPRVLSASLALSAIQSWILIYDLRQHMIINETSEEFVISDHPVVHLNTYLFGVYELDTGSLAAPGVQLLVPLSPRHALCLYDAKIYKYGAAKNDRVTFLQSTDVVDMINALQIRNSGNLVMFRNKQMLSKIECLVRKWSNKPLWEYKSFYTPARHVRPDDLRSTHAVARFQCTPQVLLPFAKIKNKVRRVDRTISVRIPEAVMAFEEIRSR